MNREGLRTIVGEDWYSVLHYVLNSENEFHVDGARSQYQRTDIAVYPSPDKVWRAFEICPLERLKLVMLFQDPYFYPKGQATGLALECGVDISPSMDRFQEAYNETFPSHFNTDILDGKLAYLARQGVLLLNTSLTVEAGKPNSHKHYWEGFTRKLLQDLYNRDNNCIFLAIGSQAKDYLPAKCIKIEIEHPAYAARNNRKWDYKDFFNKVNELLEQFNKNKIQW